MHVEVPKKGALASYKAFMGEYAMIVISILTALGLEHGAQVWHHKHVAHEAAERIYAEIAYNLQEIQKDIKKNDGSLKKITELRTFMKQGLDESAALSGEEKARYDKKFHIELSAQFDKQFEINFGSPAFRREAWEVAVASQAASWLNANELQRYSGIYATMRDITPVLTQSYATITGPTVLGALPQLQLKGGDGEDKVRRLFQLVNDTYFALQFMQGNLHAMEAVIKKDGAKA